MTPRRTRTKVLPRRTDGRTLRARPRVIKAPASSARRQAILDAGALLMRERGFVGTTVEDVAQHLDLTKAAFYYYLRNKEELLFEIASQTLARTSERIVAIERSKTSPERKLGQIIDAFVRLVGERPAFFTVYFEEKGHLAPEHLRAVTRTERTILESVERVLRAGMAGGAVRRADPGVMAFAILGMCFWTYKWFRPAGRLGLDEVSQMLQLAATRGVSVH